MPITSSNFGKALWPGINKWYGDAYAQFGTEWDKIFTKGTSRKAWEEDVSVSGFGLAAQMGEGSAVSMDTASQGFVDRYTHVQYGLGFIITKIMVEDDQYDVIAKKRAQALAFSMRQTKEVVAANVLNRAFNSAYTYGDGVQLIVGTHPNYAGGTWSNLLATAADLSEAALEQACIDLSKYTNDRGLRIAVRPQKLIIPGDLDFEANKIMKTTFEVGTNNNTVNVVKGRFPGGIVLNHYLTDTDAWFIGTDVQDGLKLIERRQDSFDFDDDFDTDNAKYKATARYSVGCTDKKAIYGTPGA